jgi:hypothetical protein
MNVIIKCNIANCHHCISAVQCLAGMKKMVLEGKTKNGKMKV